METREQRRQRESEILEYVYDVIDVNENDREYLLTEWDIYEVSKLRKLSKSDLEIMLQPDQDNSGRRLTRKLKEVMDWMKYYRKTSGDLPDSVVTWKLYLDEDILAKYNDDSDEESSHNSNGNQGNNNAATRNYNNNNNNYKASTKMQIRM